MVLRPLAAASKQPPTDPDPDPDPDPGPGEGQGRNLTLKKPYKSTLRLHATVCSQQVSSPTQIRTGKN